MTIAARILADSARLDSPAARITTFELRYPRFCHSELMTHRMLSRNAASSRALPIERMIADVLEDPAMPVHWGSNKPGMQAGAELNPLDKAHTTFAWLRARDNAVISARHMSALGLHKQIVNRILEPWAHITVICTATDWANFYHLRRDPQAQPEIHALADAMWTAQQGSTPIPRRPQPMPRRQRWSSEAWHLPLITDEERQDTNLDLRDLIKISTGRCARVSYLTHEGKRDPAADIALHDRLATSGHWSPFEHAARVQETATRSGNFYGWDQYRKTFVAEHPYNPGQVTP